MNFQYFLIVPVFELILQTCNILCVALDSFELLFIRYRDHTLNCRIV